MARIVCIANGTKRDSNNLGDVVSIHDDDVELGPSYNAFKIIEVPEISADEVRAKLQAQMPKVELRPVDGKELSEGSETKEMWLDGEKWRLVEDSPKYPMNLTLSKVEEDKLLDSKEGRIPLLETKVVATVKEKNQTEFIAEVKKVADAK